MLAGTALFALVVVACVREWADVRTTVSQLSWRDLVLAELFALGGLFASVLTWRRVLREFGHPLGVAPASKIYLVGQLGKYLPGSVWALLIQMELARKVAIPRIVTVAGGSVAIATNLVVGLAIGLFAVPAVASGELWRYVALATLFVCGVAAVLPPVQRRLRPLLGRFAGAPLEEQDDAPLEEQHVSWAGMGVASGWSIVSWCCYGMSLGVLVVATLDADVHSLALGVAALALAMTAGFAIVVAPAGIGVREAILVAALAPILAPGAALGVALVLRLLFTISDLVAAAASVPVRLGPDSRVAS